MTMNAYELKQAERKARLEDHAAKLSQSATSTLAQARRMGSAIPFGQPILIGHHSETRDRNYRARITGKMGKGFALMDKASHYANKAASVGHGGISSDDPDAIEKLRVQLASAEKMQDLMKKANACIRKNDRAGMLALGFSEEQADELFKPDFCNRIGFPSYRLSNNNSNIRRIQDRIEELEARQAKTDKEVAGNGYIYREDTSENRVMFTFECRPAETVRLLLKSFAFKWSPSRDAWVRQLTNAGIYAGAQVRCALDKQIAI
jgi:hypothetical protein